MAQGSVAALGCQVAGARPAAVITWFNGSLPFPAQPAGQVRLQPEGTYTTDSRLTFTASRHEDNQKIFCEAKVSSHFFYLEISRYYKK